MAGLPTTHNVSANMTTIKGEIVKFLWKMKMENYSDETAIRYGKFLETLAKRGTDLYNIESIKTAIVTQQWADGTKQNATNAVSLFLRYNGITAVLPTYKSQYKIAFIPTEAELDQLISGCKHRLATFLQVLKETGARYGEIFLVEWTDLNTENLTLAINHPEKGSNPRAIKISQKLLMMLSTIPHETRNLFNYKTKEVVRKSYQRARKRIAKNLANPRILQIHFHTFRHWKATMELHKTNNVLAVMKLLGHKCLSNTQRYMQLLPDLSDDYVAEVAHNTQEVLKLVENGYEYVTDVNEEKIFRKRK